MAIKRDDERHRYGRHYTPENVASLLAAFAIRSPTDLVLDPSCGDGRLIKAALKTKQQPAETIGGAKSTAALGLHRQVFGFDLMESAVSDASQYGAQVAAADFFGVMPGSTVGNRLLLPAAFDAIVGNPPYIRQEIIGADKKARVLELLNETRRTPPDPEGDNRFGGFRPQSPDSINRSTAIARTKSWSSRSDIYVYFFAHAERFLKLGGRLAFITASSWLDVGYGLELRHFLLNHFKIIAIIESAVESFFEDASVNTAITVLEKEEDLVERRANKVRFVQLRCQLAELIGSARPIDSMTFAREIESMAVSCTDERLRARVVSQGDLGGNWVDSEGSINNRNGPGGLHQGRRLSRKEAAETGCGDGTWGRYLRAADVFFRVLDRAHTGLLKLEDVASVRYGIKTGANDFFYLKTSPLGSDARGSGGIGSDGRARKLSEVAFLRRGVTTGANEFFYVRKATSPEGRSTPSGIHRGGDESSAALEQVEVVRKSSPGSNPLRDVPEGMSAVVDGSGREFEIEDAFLTPVLFSLKEIPRVMIAEGQATRFLFNCRLDRSSLAGTAAINYIENAESEGTHLRPTCRARNPWYSAIRGIEQAPLIFPSKVGERWVVAINDARVFEDKKLYGVFPAEGVPLKLLAALLNSTWARYYVEVICRQLTGAQAIADIDVAVAEQVLIPDPTSIDAQTQSELISALDAMSAREIKSIFHEVRCEDRRALDNAVLRALGFVDRTERTWVLEEIYEAATDLVRARLERSKSGKSKSRARHKA